MKTTVWMLLVALLLATGTVLASVPSSTDPIDQAAVQEVYNELDEAHVLLVKDVTGWADSNVDILDQLPEVTYDIINSASLAGTDLTDYTYVVICGGQNATFNTNVNAAMPQLEVYVEDGGWLQMHMGTNAHSPHLALWDGTSYSENTPYENTNFMGPDGDGHPLLADMVEPYSGNSANHGSHTNIPDNALIITVDSQGNATCIEYQYGQGMVVASTSPLEHAWSYEHGMGQLLWNMMEYMADAPPPGPVQFSLLPQTTTIPPTGGNVVYGVELISTLPQTVPGLSYWTEVTIPNGQTFGPLTTQGFTHTPNMNVLITNIAQAIPGLAPTGTYTFTGSIGFMPNALLDDDFEFEKIGTAAEPGGNMTPDQWPASIVNLKENVTIVR